MISVAKFNLKIPQLAASRERISVGIDIGTSQVKAVKLKFGKDAVELLGAIQEPVRADLEPVFKKIAQGFDAKNINISVAGQGTIIRYANFPSMKAEEMRQSLKFEGQKHIPFAVSEVNLDGCILKPDLPDNKMLVMLAAAKKDVVNARLKAIDQAGLKVQAVDMDSIALTNAFLFSQQIEESLKGKAVALINIGASYTNVSIVEGVIPRLNRDIQLAGNSITQRISEALACDFKSAEALKLSPNTDVSKKVPLLVEGAMSNLAGELRTSFDYYESQSTTTVARIFLSGGSSLFPGLKDSLANLLGIEAQVWDPFKKVNAAKEIDLEKIRTGGGSFAVAMGIALHS